MGQIDSKQIEANVRTVSNICKELGLACEYRLKGLPIPDDEMSKANVVIITIPNFKYRILCECDYTRTDYDVLCYSRFLSDDDDCALYIDIDCVRICTRDDQYTADVLRDYLNVIKTLPSIQS
jgi:hypothetical protein